MKLDVVLDYAYFPNSNTLNWIYTFSENLLWKWIFLTVYVHNIPYVQISLFHFAVLQLLCRVIGAYVKTVSAELIRKEITDCTEL